MNFTEIQRQAIDWMANRGWKSKWGKRGTFTQSLLQHTDIELNVLCTLLPILSDKAHYGFTEQEQQALIVGTVAHDTGKETPEWQSYVQLPEGQQRGRFVPHIIPSLTQSVVPELVNLFGFDALIASDAISFVNLHMAAARSTTSLLGTITGKSQATDGSNRWNLLARVVEAVDKFCSIHGLLPTLNYLARGQDNGVISSHIRLEYHLTSLRGVSTALLHRAATGVYQSEGWQPVLYFSNGTIYVADSRAQVQAPQPNTIISRLADVIEEAMPAKFFPKMVVGSPTSTMIPKPEFFDYREFTAYLREASQRVKKGSFLRKPESVRLSKMLDDKGTGYWQLGGKKSKSEQNLDLDSERIDRAQPLMMVFKFFRDAMKSELVGKVAGLVSPVKVSTLEQQRDQSIELGVSVEQAQARYEKALQKIMKESNLAFEVAVAQEYDAVFGAGAFARLQSTSTLMPIKEMLAVVDPFWVLPGQVLGLAHKTLEIVQDGVLQEALITKLNEVAQKVYERLPESQRPIRTGAAEIAATFGNDLIHPAPMLNIQQLAQQQQNAYAHSKPEAMRDREAARLCPICNSHFEHGTAATADFVTKPDSHTNRSVSHGYTGKIIICDACKYERFLQQLLLGEKVARVLVLTPRMHIGYWAGETLYKQAHRFHEEAQNLMTNRTQNPNENITLTLTGIVAGKLLRSDEEGGPLQKAIREGLDGDSLAHLLTYTLGSDKQKVHLRDLSKALRAEFEFEEGKEDIEAINQEWDTSFQSWDEAVQAVFAGQVDTEVVNEIRAKVYRLRAQFRVVCQTPNFILVPLVSGFRASDKESETNAALRELFVLLLIGLALDCSVAAVDAGEPIMFEGGEGVAHVPAVPAVRDLIGHDWVGLTEAPIWLQKIGAASLLAQDTAYPERSNLYQILTALTPGHVLRRIEMQRDAGLKHPPLILKALQEVPNA